jgi:hypothetical protein
MADAQFWLKHGGQFPYDATDAQNDSDDRDYNKPLPMHGDWAHEAARGVIADLSDRHTIKRGFEEVDEDTRKEIVDTLPSANPLTTEPRNELGWRRLGADIHVLAGDDAQRLYHLVWPVRTPCASVSVPRRS